MTKTENTVIKNGPW